MADTLDTVAPGFAFKEDVDVGVRSNASDVGHFPLHERETREIGISTWRLVYPTATPAERITLAGVFETAMTGDGTTTFTPPGGSLTTVRFVQSVINFSRQSNTWESVEFHIREVL